MRNESKTLPDWIAGLFCLFMQCDKYSMCLIIDFFGQTLICDLTRVYYEEGRNTLT